MPSFHAVTCTLATLAIVGFSGISSTSEAQAAFNAPPNRACPALPPTSDSIQLVALAKLRNAGTHHEPLPASFAAIVIETLRSHLTLRHTMDLSVFGPWKKDRAIPYVGAHAFFTLKQGAPPQQIAFGSATMDDDFRNELLTAIASLHGDSLPPFPNGASELPLDLVVGMSDSLTSSNALVRLTLPLYSVEQLPKRRKGGKTPEYPQEAIWRRVQDTVTMEFVIGTNGKPIESTFDIIGGTYHEFMDAVVKYLPQVRYDTMRIGQCDVDAVVEQKFTFTLR